MAKVVGLRTGFGEQVLEWADAAWEEARLRAEMRQVEHRWLQPSGRKARKPKPKPLPPMPKPKPKPKKKEKTAWESMEEQSDLSEFEKNRLANMQRNQAFLETLGLG